MGIFDRWFLRGFFEWIDLWLRACERPFDGFFEKESAEPDFLFRGFLTIRITSPPYSYWLVITMVFASRNAEAGFVKEQRPLGAVNLIYII